MSDSWGGRVSDKYLTENCINDKLLPGDVLNRDVSMLQSPWVCTSPAVLLARIHKAKSSLEVEETREIARVRIHVEWLIRAVKQKLLFLQGTLSIDFVTKRAGEPCPLIECYMLAALFVIPVTLLFPLTR